MRKSLLVLGAIILALSGALLIGALLFIVFAGVLPRRSYVGIPLSTHSRFERFEGSGRRCCLGTGGIGSAVGACGESGWWLAEGGVGCPGPERELR